MVPSSGPPDDFEQGGADGAAQDVAPRSIELQSTTAGLTASQTAIDSRGGFWLQGNPPMRWTPPTRGTAKSLLWWSESGDAFHLQGSPTIAARGIAFHGNGALSAGGSGTIDLTNVQVWSSNTQMSGGPTLRLAADPDNSIKTDGAGSSLVR